MATSAAAVKEEPATKFATIEVRLKNGRSLMVAARFDAGHLRALLAVVESC